MPRSYQINRNIGLSNEEHLATIYENRTTYWCAISLLAAVLWIRIQEGKYEYDPQK
jgi:hypothetical protein